VQEAPVGELVIGPHALLQDAIQFMRCGPHAYPGAEGDVEHIAFKDHALLIVLHDAVARFLSAEN
jgi:hypothetical protein